MISPAVTYIVDGFKVIEVSRRGADRVFCTLPMSPMTRDADATADARRIADALNARALADAVTHLRVTR